MIFETAWVHHYDDIHPLLDQGVVRGFLEWG